MTTRQADTTTDEPNDKEPIGGHACATCGKVFLSKRALGGHQSLHAEESR